LTLSHDFFKIERQTKIIFVLAVSKEQYGTFKSKKQKQRLSYLPECVFAFAGYAKFLPLGRGVKCPLKALVPLWRTITVNYL
jgi:hypothetical protein